MPNTAKHRDSDHRDSRPPSDAAPEPWDKHGLRRHLARLIPMLAALSITVAPAVAGSPVPEPTQAYVAPNATETIEDFEIQEEPVVFVPKGQWVTGVSVSYSQSNQKDYQFLVFENLKGKTYSFNVAPMLIYMVGNDVGTGGKFGYSRSLTKLEQADVILGSDTEYNVDHLYRLAHNYYGMAVLRNYFAIGNSLRFGIFNEVQLQLGGGQSKVMTGLGETLSGTYERNLNFKVGLAPGLVMFLNNYSALEVNVGVLGFSYTHTRGFRDQIYESERSSKSANFRINLFSVTFGVGFYI